MIENEIELKDYIANNLPCDAIVVEGYDGVGKGKILSLLSEFLSVEPYRPDYNLWQKYDHRVIDRWKVSGFFWDVYSHFTRGYHVRPPMLFDRGVISGAVYNHDDAIARDYKQIIRDMKILHILVVCDEEDYKKFSEIRGVETSSYEDYKKYTEEYLHCLDIAGVDYVVYKNKFSKEESERLATTCAGCGHYSYGWCRHPSISCRVDSNKSRCEYSNDKEVQDLVAKM